MCCQLGVQSGAQAVKGMSMVDLDVKLLRQLAVDRFNQLTNGVEHALLLARNLLFLVMFVLVVVGTGLIGLIWGLNAMFLSSICLVSGAALIGGLWLLLTLIQKWVDE